MKVVEDVFEAASSARLEGCAWTGIGEALGAIRTCLSRMGVSAGCARLFVEASSMGDDHPGRDATVMALLARMAMGSEWCLGRGSIGRDDCLVVGRVGSGVLRDRRLTTVLVGIVGEYAKDPGILRTFTDMTSSDSVPPDGPSPLKAASLRKLDAAMRSTTLGVEYLRMRKKDLDIFCRAGTDHHLSVTVCNSDGAMWSTSVAQLNFAMAIHPIREDIDAVLAGLAGSPGVLPEFQRPSRKAEGLPGRPVVGKRARGGAIKMECDGERPR